jgi:hypothetical protein
VPRRCDAYNEALRLRCDYLADHVIRHHAQIDGQAVTAWGHDMYEPPPITITHVEVGRAAS